MIRVLYVNEHIETMQNGGDMVQMRKTKEYIEKINQDIEITICDSIDNDTFFENADIVHIFNVQTVDYSWKALEKAKSYGKKVVLSTIYWDLLDAIYVANSYKILRMAPNLVMKCFKPLGDCINGLLYRLLGNKSNPMFNKKHIVKNMIKSANFLLPNSDEELMKISEFYDLDFHELQNKAYVVPNAVDTSKVIDAQRRDDKVEFSNYVLQVGAINSVKNQLQVVRALKDVDVPIVFIGKGNNGPYLRRLKKEANLRGNVHFVNEIPNEQVYAYYKNALCHILPSFRESPGLSSLESYAMGTPIIVSEKRYCPVGYYKFDKIALICDPYSKKSIRKCVETILNTEKKNHTNDRYIFDYSYDRVAQITYNAYIKIVEGC